MSLRLFLLRAGGRDKPGVAGAASEHPLERVESNEVRTRGKPPPPIIRKRVMLKATYSEED